MIPLVVRSAYSFGWGVNGIAALCRHARRQGYRRLALTDTDNLCGVMPFAAACEEEGLAPIVGAEITDPKTSRRAVCLAKDAAGYENLCRLLTRRHTHARFDLVVDMIDLSGGLAVLTTSPALLFAGHAAGVDISAALPRRPVPRGHRLPAAARQTGVPLVAVPDSFFNRPGDFAVHRLLRAIDNNTTTDRLAPGDTAPADAFLAKPAEYRRRFAVCPGAVRNTFALSERIAFTRPAFGTVMPPWEEDTPGEAAARLQRAAYEGARRRYGEISPDVADRLAHELAIIAQKGFCGYFLVVSDIVRNSPRTCGRGSAAASLVAYCLGITNVCPVKHNLYFERFLNPGRDDPPDIDVDFAWDERDAVIASVLEKYRGRAAMVSSHICFQQRMAVRETARVYGFSEREIRRMAGKLKGSRDSGADGSPDAFPCAGLPPPWPAVLSLAGRITGLPRHLSLHPGGVVITPGDMAAYVPVQFSGGGVPLLQWDKDALADAGLVKIDLLGNRSLGVIRDAIADIRGEKAETKEESWTPEEDLPTRETLARGDTMGCFYIESPAMRLLQQKTGVGDFEHLVIHSSIIRPAANDVIREYVRRLRGGRWRSIHPLLDEVLAETLGLMIFQEDVSRVAVAVAGFSHAEADGLRKVMSRKDRARRLGDYSGRFAKGARERGLDREQVEKTWQMIMSFSGYSFCKPHSASYARISFEAAYLKTHFPAAFMAAVISNQGGFYSTFAYVSEAKRLGLTVLPPDVGESRIRWTGRGRSLRVGLLSVKGLSSETMHRILRGRETACFSGFSDFMARVRPDAAEARALIASGALDRFSAGEKNRASLLWRLAVRQKASAREGTGPHLFSDPPKPGFARDASAAAFPDPPPELPPELPPDDPLRNLRREFGVLGFLCDRHPITLLADRIRGAGAVKAERIPRYAGCRIRFAGWLITGKTIVTVRNEPMTFVTFEDETGLVETVFFPRAYRRFSPILEHGRPFLISGTVGRDHGAVTLTAEAVERI